MSSKSTIFLTNDNEHCYYEMAQETPEGFAIVLEMSKDNIEIRLNDSEDLVIEIKPGSELYKKIQALKDNKK